MTKTVIGLLRHGQTDWNIDFRLQGITDIELNETGLEQARQAAEVIDSSDWDIVVSSPLSRARVTAQIVADANGLTGVEIEPLLLERSFGEAEGLMHEEWREKYPDQNLVPGGETLPELTERAWQLLDLLIAKYPGQRVLTVSHGALIRKLLKLVSEGQFPREGERLGNASLSVFEHDESGWRVASYEPKTLTSKTPRV
ncbi:MAG: hypothetical protein RLZZ229_285 [Actinomycetota bacterium]